MSSSLPEEVQLQFYHSIKGLEHCLVMRCAYAIEYDCVDPLQMAATLELWTTLAYTEQGSLTAAPAMRRPPPRAWWPE